MVDAQRVYLIIYVGLFSIIDIASQFLILSFNILMCTNICTCVYKYIWSKLRFVLIIYRQTNSIHFQNNFLICIKNISIVYYISLIIVSNYYIVNNIDLMFYSLCRSYCYYNNVIFQGCSGSSTIYPPVIYKN